MRGFTLIEILAVLAVLTLLMSISVLVFKGGDDKARRADTMARFGSLESLIATFLHEHGDYPPDRFRRLKTKIKAGNDVNEGIEACLAALYSKDHPTGGTINDEYLGNTDGDSTTTDFHRYGSNQLVELLDGWGNPVVYLHNSSYEDGAAVVRMGDAAHVQDAFVEARRSTVTGVWAKPDKYQLISAGPDSVFGTDDDVTNFGDG